jgi:hypothetical protein
MATGVIVTQVVPAVDGHSSLVLDYKSALAKYFPGQASDYVEIAEIFESAYQFFGIELGAAPL